MGTGTKGTGTRGRAQKGRRQTTGSICVHAQKATGARFDDPARWLAAASTGNPHADR